MENQVNIILDDCTVREQCAAQLEHLLRKGTTTPEVYKNIHFCSK